VKKERAQGLWDIDEEVDTPGVKTMEGEVEGVADVEEIIKRGYYCIQGLRCDVETSITHTNNHFRSMEMFVGMDARG